MTSPDLLDLFRAHLESVDKLKVQLKHFDKNQSGLIERVEKLEREKGPPLPKSGRCSDCDPEFGCYNGGECWRKDVAATPGPERWGVFWDCNGTHLRSQDYPGDYQSQAKALAAFGSDTGCVYFAKRLDPEPASEPLPDPKCSCEEAEGLKVLLRRCRGFVNPDHALVAEIDEWLK